MPAPRFHRVLRLACLAVVAAVVALPALSAPPPPSAFANLPSISEVDLSPNGQLIAFADRGNAQERVVVLDLATGDLKRQFGVESAMKLRTLYWSDDDTVLIEVSQTIKEQGRRYEFFRTLAADVTSGKTRILLMGGGSRTYVTSADVLARHTTRPGRVVMSTLDWSSVAAHQQTGTHLGGHRGDSGWVSMLFEVDTGTGKVDPLDQGTQFTDEWVVDKDGQTVARSEWNPKVPQYQILLKQKLGWKQIFELKNGGTLRLHGLTSDGAAIVAIGENDARHWVLWTVPLDGSGAKILFEDPDYDVETVIHDRYSNLPVGVRLGGPEQAYHWFDKKARARHESVARAFKDRVVQVYGSSQDGKRVLARVDSPSQPAIYYLVDYTKGTADIVGDEYPALADVPLGEVRSITYKARDGTAIPAYLTLPPGVSPKNLPLVVLPHGGPVGRDSHAFDYWAQFLATRGYAVLQPQFRGSTGFGAAYQVAGYKQWGGLMQDDVTDGVQAMIEQQIADAHRVCIVGGSYGGYAALAGAAFTPELYKCAVSVSGVSDLPEMLESVKTRFDLESDPVAYWRDVIGLATDRNVIEHSPARAADRIQIPVLLLHGEDDTVVPIAQSQYMLRALTKLGKKVSLVKMPSEDHWLSRADSRLKMLTEIEQFLRENL